MRAKKTRSMSRRIAAGVLLIDGTAVGIVLYLCRLSILLGFTGSLPYLTALIGTAGGNGGGADGLFQQKQGRKYAGRHRLRYGDPPRV